MPPRVAGGGPPGRAKRRHRGGRGQRREHGTAAPGAIAVGGAARAEDERWRGGLGGETDAVREHEQPAVEALPQVHAAPRVGAAAGQLHPAGAEADGVVVGHAARIPTAERGGEIARGRAPGAPGVSGRPREARVEVSEEGGEKGNGRLEHVDAAQTQLAHEAVLQGLPEALDAALGLGGMRGDAPSAGRPGALPFGSS